MDDIVETYQGFTLIRAPFDRVLPALIGGGRGLSGNVAWREGDRRRALRFQAEGNAEARGSGGVYTFPPVGIIEASDAMTLIEDALNFDFVKTLSLLLPEEAILSIRSWTEGTVRSAQYLVINRAGLRERLVGATKGIEKRGWFLKDLGPVSPFEDPFAYAAPSIRARVDRPYLYGVARAFGIDIDAALMRKDNRRGLVELLSPEVPDLAARRSLDHMDISRRCVAWGHGDPLHLEMHLDET